VRLIDLFVTHPIVYKLDRNAVKLLFHFVNDEICNSNVHL